MDKRNLSRNKENVKGFQKQQPIFTDKLQQMLCETHDCLLQFEIEKAYELSKNLVKKYPTNPDVLEIRANVALEMSDYTAALEYLDKVIAAQPFSGYTHYLSKAQLLNGNGSLEQYNKAIDIMKIEVSKFVEKQATVAGEDLMDVDAPNGSCSGSTSQPITTYKEYLKANSGVTLMRELSTAYCCVAELYVTDLCDEPNAEELCKAAIQLAIDADPKNPESYIMKARFLEILGECDQARAVLEDSRALWTPPDPDQDIVDDVSSVYRKSAAKVFMELDMYSDAQKMLECLLLENDQDVEVLYLIGWNNYLDGCSDITKHYFEKALQSHKENPFDDKDILKHIHDTLKEIEENEYEDIEDDEEVEDEELEKEILELALKAEANDAITTGDVESIEDDDNL